MDFKLVGDLTLEEALQMAYENELEPIDIFIEPPDPNVITDEDSGEEDDGALVDNLNRNQLRAKVEVVVKENHNIKNIDESLADVNEGHEEQYNVTERPGNQFITWSDGDLIPNEKHFSTGSYDKFRGLSILETFEKFISEDIIVFLIEEATKYALFLNENNPMITVEEMKSFIAILLVTGYNKLPGRDYYWDSRDDMKNKLVSENMRRDRFRQILKYIHCADNTQPKNNDKMWKLRPLMNKLKQKFMENWNPEQNLDFDESMIKYFGRHSCKQFIRGKPIRFGYKMWCLNTPSGYLLNFDIYQGKNPGGNEEYEKKFGKCIAPLINMVDEFPLEVKQLPLRFYFDNLFTGFNVLHYLKERGYDGTGTIRENRIPKSCPLPDKKHFVKNSTRGESKSSIDKEDGIIVVKWLDNNLVSAASTCHGIAPISYVKRYSQKLKRNIQITRPSIITEYNRYMGGTDRLDENVSTYRISIRRKKWWWPIFTWLLDVAVVNAWTIYRAANTSKLSQLEFRREIATNYLMKYKNAPKSGGRPATSRSSLTLNRVSDEVRYDGVDHLLTYNKDKKKRRCAGEGCTSIVRTICAKCDVGMCLECNYIFHTRG